MIRKVFKILPIALIYIVFMQLFYSCGGPSNELKVRVMQGCKPLPNVDISTDKTDEKYKTDSDGWAVIERLKSDKENEKIKLTLRQGSKKDTRIISLKFDEGKQEETVFFKKKSVDVSFKSNSDNIYYQVIDNKYNCTLYDEYEQKTLSLSSGGSYKIRYSVDEGLEENVFEIKKFKPSKKRNIVELNIFQVTVETEDEYIAYKGTIKNKEVLSDMGEGTFYLREEGRLKIYQLGCSPPKQETIDINQEEVEYFVYLENCGSTLFSSDPLMANIKVGNKTSSWEIYNKNGEKVVAGKGNKDGLELERGKYTIKEVYEKDKNPRSKDFTIINKNVYVNFDLSRSNVTIVTQPSNSSWVLKRGNQTIEEGKGTTSIDNMQPGKYKAQCTRPDGSKTSWINFELGKKSSTQTLDCSVACVEPKIEIDMASNEVEKWNILVYKGSRYQDYKKGSSSKEVSVDQDQTYMIKWSCGDFVAEHPDKISFGLDHPTCSEKISIECGCDPKIENAIDKGECSEVINLEEGCNFGSDRDCSHYSSVAQCYDEMGKPQSALKLALRGWERSNKKQCLALQSDPSYMYFMLLYAEKVGVDSPLTEKVAKSLGEDGKKIDGISDNKTKMYALYWYLNYNMPRLTESVKDYKTMTKSQKSNNRDDNCTIAYELGEKNEELIELMDYTGSTVYKKSSTTFNNKIQNANAIFECD